MRPNSPEQKKELPWPERCEVRNIEAIKIFMLGICGGMLIAFFAWIR